MAVGDIYQVKLYSEYSGRSGLNVFHFNQQDPDPGGLVTAPAILSAWYGSISTSLRAILHEDATILEATMVCLPFLAFNAVQVINQAGTYVDTDGVGMAPSFVSAAFRFNRVAIGQRYGWKRFSGIPLAALEGNAYESAYQTLLEALANDLEDGFDVSGVHFAAFVAHHPIVLGANPTGYITQSVNVNRVGTQDTRKD